MSTSPPPSTVAVPAPKVDGNPAVPVRYLVEDDVLRLELLSREYQLRRDRPQLAALYSDWRALGAGLRGMEAHPSRLMTLYLDQHELEQLQVQGLPWMTTANIRIVEALERMEKELAGVQCLLATHW